jgi:hypothetical protein
MSWVNRVLGDEVDVAYEQAVKAGFPEGTARKIATGELPMDYESRMQRAREQGFDVDNTYYHGTDANISAFDPSKRGESTGANSAKMATWLTDDPVTANSYANYAAMDSKVKALVDSADKAADSGDWDLYESMIQQAEDLESSFSDIRNRNLGQNIIPVFTQSNLPQVEMNNKSFDDEGVSDQISKYLYANKINKNSGVRFNNLDDAVGLSFQPSNHAAVLDDTKIRSINAAFDPDNKNSGNLLGLNSKKKLSTNPLDYINPQAIPQDTTQPEMRPVNWDDMTWSERVNDAIYYGLESAGVDERLTRKLTEDASTALSFTGLDGSMNVADYLAGKGDAVSAGFGLLDLIPGIGKGAGMAAKQIFAGAKAAARLGKLDDMRKAEKMLGEGASKERVYRETGFFKGKDGNMRFEIDDSKANYIPDVVISDAENKLIAELGIRPDLAKRAIEKYGANTTASEALLHPELYKAYPEIQRNPVKIEDLSETPNDGYFMRDSNLIGVNSKSKEGRNTLLHELQHLVQKSEGFDRGTNTIKAPTEREDLEYALKQQNNYLYDLRKALTNDFESMDQTRKQWVDASKYKDYQKLVDYANSENPTSIKRHIMAMDYYLHADGIRDMPEAKELARRRYDMPKSSRPKQERAAWLRDYAFDMAQLVKKTIDKDAFNALKDDKRKIDSIIKKNERDLERKRSELSPYYNQKSYVDELEVINDNLRSKPDQKVYEYKYGEAEARNVENRSQMSQEERKQSYPDMTMTEYARFGGKQKIDPKYLWTEEMLRY